LGAEKENKKGFGKKKTGAGFVQKSLEIPPNYLEQQKNTPRGRRKIKGYCREVGDPKFEGEKLRPKKRNSTKTHWEKKPRTETTKL